MKAKSEYWFRNVEICRIKNEQTMREKVPLVCLYEQRVSILHEVPDRLREKSLKNKFSNPSLAFAEPKAQTSRNL